MGPKILLICQVSQKRKLFISTLPPLGILGIASYLEKNGIWADVIDYNVDNGSKVDLKDYDIIGLTVNMANISTSLEYARYIKTQNSKAKIIVGGPSCISNPKYFTQSKNIDAVCTGEGEEAFLDYIMHESFINGKEIPGLYTKTRKGHFVYGGDRKYLSNLDILPFPALNKISLDKYDVPISKRSPISNIMTSRGCPFHCIFCFHSLGYNWRVRSPVNVVDEIEWQVKGLGVREICIQDDNFSLDVNRANQIFDLILKRNIKVKLQFCNGLRVDFVDFELLNKMYQAGVWMIGVAPETGSLKVMKEIKKNMDLEKFKQVVRWCQNIGINTFSYFMIGFPFETKEDFKETAFFTKELNTDFMQLSRVMPLPTTPLYEMAVNDDFRNTFNQEQGIFFGIPKLKPPEISDREMARLIKQMHRSFYLNPIRMIRLLRILPLRQLIKLFIYSIRTANI